MHLSTETFRDACDLYDEIDSFEQSTFRIWEVADFLDVSTATVLRRVHDGTLSAIRVGQKSYRISKAALLHFISSFM